MTLVLAVLAALLWWPVLSVNPAVPQPHPSPLDIALLAAAFVVCELFPFRMGVQRETLMVSLSELPLVIGLLLFPAWIVVSVHLGSGLLVYLGRRDSWRNDLLNLTLIAVEAGAAAAIILLFRGDSTASERFLPVALGVLVGALASAVAVGVAYRMIGPAESLLRVVLRSMLTAAAIVSFALVGFTVWTSGRSGQILCVALAGALGVIYRTYSLFLRQHAGLAQMYAFGRSVAAAGSEITEWEDLVGQVRAQLNARVAVIHLTDRPDGPQSIAVGPDGRETEPMPAVGDPLLADATARGGIRASADRTSDPAVLNALQTRHAGDVIVVPLRSGERIRGYLEVRDRRTRWGRFSDEDLWVLESLGGHVGTALDNLRLVERLRHEAYHDQATGLRNRLGMSVDSQRLIEEGTFGGMLVVQLNLLSDVNSALGHERGEELLAAAAARLTSVAGPAAVVGRIEADRFAILLSRGDEAAAVSLARAVLAEAGRTYVIAGVDVEPNIFAGIVLYDADDPQAGTNNATLLQRGEMALTAASAGQGQLEVYRPEMGEVYRRRFQLITQFRRAVEAGRIVVHYQPKLDLAQRELEGVEALVRWMHPEYGMVGPGEFVEAIEATGAIDVLFSHVLETALAQAAFWSARGMRIGVAVNMSVRNLLTPDFARSVAEALQRHGVPPELLTAEITESSVMAQPENSMPALRELHALGVRLSIDDFGTGYSSLAYLRRLPIDEIKIDRSFVNGMVTDLGDLAIVRAIIDLGHSLGLRVVAEGVEEEVGRDALRSMRCDGIQGFLVSRPLPPERFDAWLATRTVQRVGAEGAEPEAVRVLG